MRMQSWLPKKIKKYIKISGENIENNDTNSNAILDSKDVANDTNVSTDYALEDTFIDLYIHIGSTTSLQILDFRRSYLSHGAWIISQKTSSELYRVDTRFMNSVNEWDPGKHGWFRILSTRNPKKSTDLNNKIVHTPIQTLRNYFNLKVQNCKQQSFHAYFHGTTAESILPLRPLSLPPGNEISDKSSPIQQYSYKLRKRTNILSISRVSNSRRRNKISLNLAIVTKDGPFKLYPSLNDSLSTKEYIDPSFNASVEMDEDGNTWLLLNIGRSCGRLISGDARNENDRSLLTR